MMGKIKYLLLLCVMTAVLFASGCAKDGHVANNVSVMGVDVSAMSRDDAIKALKDVVLDGTLEATIVVGEEKIVISADEIGASYNIEKTVDNVIEKSKSFFAGLIKKDYAVAVDIDGELLDIALNDFETEGAATSAAIADEGIMITNAYPSKKLDREKLCEAIAEGFGKGEDANFDMEYIITPVFGPSDREVLSELGKEFKDSSYIMDEAGNITVTESSVGVVFDMDEALKLMGEHTDEGETYLIPCEVKMPTHTKEELEAALFRDTLGSYKTNFSSSSANRASNIGLATESISGLVLMPGDVFSFNGTVGERTVARGYKTAGAYVAGETVDQVGGGICQVSSTLYNTVLLSNLEITERRSHQMTVSYVPMGRDATVNWGTTDFRFKNNTEYPVKIVGEINGRNVTISIVGTETIENKRVEIVTSTVSTLAPPVETIEDPTKAIGFTETTQKGTQGYVVDATRVVYSGDTEISREGLVRSRYSPKKTIMTVGTMESVAIPEDEIMPPGLMPPTVTETATVPAA